MNNTIQKGMLRIPFFLLMLSLVACQQKSEAGSHESDAAAQQAANSAIRAADTVRKPLSARTIRFAAVGDIMIGSNYPSKSKLPPDAASLMKPAESALQSADVTFGNCEGTFLDNGGTPKGSGANVYCFRQPVDYAGYLKASGYDLISIANNHINDFGPVGIESTVNTLKKQGFAFAGTPDYPFATFEKDGALIGLLAFAPHNGCLNFNETTMVVNMVKQYRSQCDILLVSFHAGAEGRSATHVPKRREIFLGQDRGDVHAFAHAVIDAGADVVIGHGPHVARALEVYKNKLIAYSLGNFCTYGMFSLSGVSGYAPLLRFNLNEKGDLVDGEILSFRQEGEGGPVPDPSSSVATQIRQLTEVDFPNTPIIWDNKQKGVFRKK